MQLILVLLCGIVMMMGLGDCKSTYDQSQTGEFNVQVDLKDLEFFALLKGDREEYYEDIDYAYDYSEMTIRPQSGTSKKPLNVTTVADNVLDNSTIDTTVYIDQTTEPIQKHTLEDAEKINATQYVTITGSAKANRSEVETPTTTSNLSESSIISPTLQSTKVEHATTISDAGNLTASSISSYTVQSSTLSPSTTVNVDLTTTLKNKLDTTKSPLNAIPSNNTVCKKGFILNQRGGCDLKLQSMSNALLKIVKLSQKLKSRRRQQRRFDPDAV